jgi:CheY-like chemotaxis protein
MTPTKKRILIVDDEVGFTRLLRLNLEQTGSYEAQEVNVPSQAFAAALTFRPDLVLLDVMMPGADGGSVAAQLQAHAATKSLPVVFVTAAVKKAEVASRQGQIGGLRYIAKPVDFKDLLELLDRLLAAAAPAATYAAPSGSSASQLWLSPTSAPV